MTASTTPVVVKQRMSRNLQFMFNYTWGAEIDDNGTFRSGYLPTRIERSRGTSDTPNVINSTAVWNMPFGAGQAINRWSADTSFPVSTLTVRATRSRSQRPDALRQERARACPTMRPDTRAVSIGSETDGGVSKVRVFDLSLSLDGADNGIRIKSNAARGGLVHDVSYEDVCVRNSPNPILLDTA